MTKFDKAARTTARFAGPGAVKSTSATPDIATYEGGPGYTRDTKGELFMLAVSNFVKEDTFYEMAAERDDRYKNLVHAATQEDPAWTAAFIRWLRTKANMRSASLVAAIEYGRALGGKVPTYNHKYHDVASFTTPRSVLADVMVRADEPGEALAYWLSQYGRPLPKWLKRALDDGASRLYNPFMMLKYDTPSHNVRFGDVLEFAQGSIDSEFRVHLLDRRHGRDDPRFVPEMAQIRDRLNKMHPEEARAELLDDPKLLRDAGLTWEALSGFGAMDAEAWEQIIPLMNYMSLIRNLRNFDQAGVSRAVCEHVAAKLRDPEQVARSRQLPMRFLSAYANVHNDFWKPVLDDALEASLVNLPSFTDHWLIMIDTSSSMNAPFSANGQIRRDEAAALFGLAIARRCGSAAVYSFSTGLKEFTLTTGRNVLSETEKFCKGYLLHGGTQTIDLTRHAFEREAKAGRRPSRTLIVTDEQCAESDAHAYGGWGWPRYTMRELSMAVPETVPLYTFNVAGYKAGHAPSALNNRHAFGGLSDKAFGMLASLEARDGGKWPFEVPDLDLA